MIGELLILVVAAIVLFEVVEHVLIPIGAGVAGRKRQAITGAEGMVGKIAVVKSWSGRRGRVVIDGELWTATSSHPLSPGDTASVEHVDGLTLRLKTL